jgi:tRNA/tmRNA/rRNA uracil-C5-methylase (TrmA/RlmC/RlmD family)
MDFTFENALKASLIKEAFVQQKVEIKVPKNVLHTNKQWEYRNKYNYCFDNNYNFSVLLRESNIVKKTDQISLPNKLINTTAKNILNTLKELKIDPRALKNLLIRSSNSGKTLSRLYITSELEANKIINSKKLNAQIMYFDFFYPARSHLMSGTPLNAQSKKNQSPTLTDYIFDKKFTYSIDSFFQINQDAYKLALQDIFKFIDKNSKVLDFYSGVGSIGLTIPKVKRASLKLIEADKNSFYFLQKNIKDTNAKAILSKSDKALNYITKNSTVIFNPARSGLNKPIINYLLKVLPQKIIYLSCNPITQARDVKLLISKYKILFVQGYNFFPKTSHIENLVVLIKK